MSVSSWFALMSVLTLEVALVFVLALLIQRWTRSGVWQRTIWQVSLFALALLVVAEISGVARGVASLVSFNNDAVSSNGRRMGSFQNANSPVQLNEDFRRRVQERVAHYRQESETKTDPLPSPSSPPQTTTPASALVNLESSSFSADRVNTEPEQQNASDLSLPGRLVWWPGIVWFLGAAILGVRTLFIRCLLLLFRARYRAPADAALDERVQALARRLGIRRLIHLKEFPRIAAPVAFGVCRPTIGLPPGFTKNFSPAQQDAVLAHELAHLAARDPLWHGLADLVVAALWWHPLAWLARRQLQAANESAADEASVVVADGPKVLAECLVQLGGRLTAERSLGWLNMAGFRSDLGHRVERLVNLPDGAWSPPSRFRAWMARTAGPVALVATGIFCTAWITPPSRDQTQMKGEHSMKTIKQYWLSSVANAALVAALGADNSLLAQAKPEEPKPAQIEQAESPPPKRANDDTTGPRISAGRQKILAQLQSIVLDEVSFDNRPLGEVIKNIGLAIKARDPDESGINFVILSPGTPPTNSSTGLKTPPVEPLGLDTLNIKITPALRNVRLSDVLDAIVRGAKRPIRYSVEDYAIMFIPKFESEPLVLYKRAFHVDPRTFLKKMKDTVRVPESNQELNLSELIHDFFLKAGVDLSPPKSVFFNDRGGTLLVQATFKDLDNVEQAIQKLNAPEPKPDSPPKPDGAVKKTTPGTDSPKKERAGEATAAVDNQSSPNAPPSSSSSDALRHRYGLANQMREMMRRYGMSPGAANQAVLDQKMAARYGLLAQANSARPGQSQANEDTPQTIQEKLQRIVLDEISFDALPLTEVVKYLYEESKKRDPEKQGINFLITNNADTPAPAIDPATGLPVPASAPDVPMDGVAVKFNLPLRNVRLLDVLNAIVKVADQPVKYSVEEFGVVFSPDAQSPRIARLAQPTAGEADQLLKAASEKSFKDAEKHDKDLIDAKRFAPAEPEQLKVRTFKVDSASFLQGLEGTFGIASPGSESFNRNVNALRKLELQLKDAEEAERGILRSTLENATGETSWKKARSRVTKLEDAIESIKGDIRKQGAEQSKAVQETLRTLFDKLGVNMDSPKAVFYNPVTGIVMVKVSARDLDVVQAALETLGGNPISAAQHSAWLQGFGGLGTGSANSVKGPVLGDLPTTGRFFRSEIPGDETTAEKP